jgi:hypothetical protein
MKTSKRLQQIYNNDIKNSKLYKPMLSNKRLTIIVQHIARNYPEIVPTIEETIHNLEVTLRIVDELNSRLPKDI